MLTTRSSSFTAPTPRVPPGARRPGRCGDVQSTRCDAPVPSSRGTGSLAGSTRTPGAAGPAAHPRSDAGRPALGDGIAWGTPTRFGNNVRQMKQFLDTRSAVAEGQLEGSAGVFTQPGSCRRPRDDDHDVMLPLLHLGMVLLGRRTGKILRSDRDRDDRSSPYGPGNSPDDGRWSEAGRPAGGAEAWGADHRSDAVKCMRGGSAPQLRAPQVGQLRLQRPVIRDRAGRTGSCRSSRSRSGSEDSARTRPSKTIPRCSSAASAHDRRLVAALHRGRAGEHAAACLELPFCTADRGVEELLSLRAHIAEAAVVPTRSSASAVVQRRFGDVLLAAALVVRVDPRARRAS